MKKKVKTTKNVGRNTLSMVKKFYPDVERVIDATKSLDVEVTRATTQSAAVRKHNNCALAVQCKKTFNLDGAVVSRTRVYLIKDDTAVRYAIPQSATREIVSFDRGGGFEPGIYQLNAPSESCQLGRIPANSRRDGSRGGEGSRPRHHKPHLTQNIRTQLWEESE